MLFYFFAIIIILMAFIILFTKNVLYAAFALMLLFLNIAALYVLAGADFLAITQIIVYVGGVLILLIFGMMLTQASPNKQLLSNNRSIFLGILVGWAIFLSLGYFIRQTPFELQVQHKNNKTSVYTLGVNLLTDYITPFEAIAILLLVALVGASMIANKK